MNLGVIYLAAFADLDAFAHRRFAGAGGEVEAPAVKGADEVAFFDDAEHAEVGLAVGAEAVDDVVAHLHFVACHFG